jgi:hypothetical protein
MSPLKYVVFRASNTTSLAPVPFFIQFQTCFRISKDLGAQTFTQAMVFTLELESLLPFPTWQRMS